MNPYKEGFSAVGFDCSEENFLTGVVNLTDAVWMIEKITRQGIQVCVNWSLQRSLCRFWHIGDPHSLNVHP